jgi:hypothetical protein
MNAAPQRLPPAGRPLLWCAWALVALLVAVALATFYRQAQWPGNGIFLAVPLVLGPAALRAAAAARRRKTRTFGALALTALASLGIASVVAVASCIAFGAICTAGTLSLMGMSEAMSRNSFLMLEDPLKVTVAVSAAAATIVFAGLLYALWPRVRNDEPPKSAR